MHQLDIKPKTTNITGKLIRDIVLQLLSYVAETERVNFKQKQKRNKIAKKGVIFSYQK